MNLQSFNEKQLEAVTAPLGPVAVIAGAGTGKTHVLTSRFIFLTEEYQLLPKRILAITFTNKAANEMKTRIEKATGFMGLHFICTFHSLCVKILREDISHLGRTNNFNIIDEDDVSDLLKEIYKDKGITTKDLSYRRMSSLISIWKSKQYGIDDLQSVLDENNNYGFNTEGALRLAFDVYLTFLQKQEHLNLLDFDDLLFFASKLLETNSSVRNKWKNRFDYILVDEFQDINDLQFNLINALTNDNHDLFVVGDPDQTIYSWRGANSAILQDFMKLYPETLLIILERNYRSTQNILNAANTIIKENTHRYEKNLYTQNNEGNKIVYYEGRDEKEEAEWVCKKIEDILKNKLAKPNEICVLYRSKHLSRSLEQTFIERGVKYKVIGGYKFYQRKEIKDIIAYFKVIDNFDELSLKRIANIPRRKISTETIAKLSLYAFENKITLFEAFQAAEKLDDLTSIAKNACVNFSKLILELKEYTNTHKITELFDKVYHSTGYDLYLQEDLKENKDEYVMEFKQAINFYEESHKDETVTLTQYLQDIALFTSLDEESNRNVDSILLMTVHQAKGLEFDYVFLTYFTDDSFPSMKSQEEENIDEERRIAYVALTRARKNLFITMNSGYNVRLNKQRFPSRFFKPLEINHSELLLKDENQSLNISDKDLEWFDSKNRINADEMYNTKSYDFKIGDNVIHTHFGQGKVIDVNADSITVLFNNKQTKGVKILAKNHKALKRIVN